MMDLFLTNTMDWGGVDYLWIIVIVCLDSHSDGTHSLQRILWWASDAFFIFGELVHNTAYTVIYYSRSCRHTVCMHTVQSIHNNSVNIALVVETFHPAFILPCRIKHVYSQRKRHKNYHYPWKNIILCTLIYAFTCSYAPFMSNNATLEKVPPQSQLLYLPLSV